MPTEDIINTIVKLSIQIQYRYNCRITLDHITRKSCFLKLAAPIFNNE